MRHHHHQYWCRTNDNKQGSRKEKNIYITCKTHIIESIFCQQYVPLFFVLRTVWVLFLETCLSLPVSVVRVQVCLGKRKCGNHMKSGWYVYVNGRNDMVRSIEATVWQRKKIVVIQWWWYQCLANFTPTHFCFCLLI